MPLLERDATLDAIQQLVARAGRGWGGALFVIGEAGFGKTSVLDWAVQAARDNGFKIGAGRGDVAEAMLPFGVLEQALQCLLSGDRIPDAVNEALEDLTAAGRFWTVLRQLRKVANRPVLIALDDLQWADPDSLALIHLLCRRLAGLPMALIATARPWPEGAAATAESLEAQHLAAVSRLEPLTRGAAERSCSRMHNRRCRRRWWRMRLTRAAVTLCF
jgi:predicted ATPase